MIPPPVGVDASAPTPASAIRCSGEDGAAGTPQAPSHSPPAISAINDAQPYDLCSPRPILPPQNQWYLQAVPFQGKTERKPSSYAAYTSIVDGGDDGGDSCRGVAPLVGIRDSETSTTSPACAFPSCSSRNHASYPPPPMQGCGATQRVCSSCLDRPS